MIEAVFLDYKDFGGVGSPADKYIGKAATRPSI